jgi:hypothetical protein
MCAGNNELEYNKLVAGNSYAPAYKKVIRATHDVSAFLSLRLEQYVEKAPL